MILRLIRKIARPAAMLAVLMCLSAFECAAMPADSGASGTSPSETQSYIVVYEHPQFRGLRALAADPAARVKTRLQEQTRATFDLIDGALVELTAEEANSLAAEPGVAYVEPDYPVYALSQTVPWGIERVFEQETFPFPSWDKGSGEGISVAVLDTGINGNHEDLPALAGGITTVDSSDWGVDESGHGTRSAGIIAAQINEFGTIGAAPSVDLYSVKVLDGSGEGSLSSILDGIQWAVDHGIDIISMSLGTTMYSQSLEDICDAAYASGHLLVAAAGNSGNAGGTGSNMEYPAIFESVIAVGATDSKDKRADFSSTGVRLEVMAPGVDIYSTSIDTSLSAEVNVNGKDYYSKNLDGSGTGDVSAVLVPCGEALDRTVLEGILEDRGIVPGSDWIAFIDRGTNTFAEKVLLVMDLGACGAIIADNDADNPETPGDFTLYATEEDEGREWIPTAVVSYNAGLSIKADLEAGEGEGSGDVTGNIKVDYDPYEYSSGTSMATPHVSAAAAVLWSAEPTLTNEEIRQILRDTALDLGLPAEQQGYGLIQLNMALDRAADIAEERAMELVSLVHDSDQKTVEAELSLYVLPHTQGTVYFALYDASGRFLTCRAYPVNVTEYRQELFVSADYDTDHMSVPAKAKVFFVGTDMGPFGLQLEAILP